MSIRAEKRHVSEISLYDPIGTDSDGNDIALSDILGSDADCVPDAVQASLDGERVRAAMKKALTERERKVLTLRFGLGGGYAMTQREIARVLGISRSYISRIEKKALSKMTEALERD
ncbi:MAG: sigma-70 family RNA polymerase sigma factor [Clostridia bacterium]|nr:sigma-70 family RNA polymerase sigma factor [Clostridia bacterium]